MNIIVTGSLGFDYIMDYLGKFADRIMADKIHKISLSFLVNKLNKQFGGTAGNIAYSLRLLGMSPLILSTAGNDFELYRKHLIAHQISTDHIKERKEVMTGSYFVVTDQDDNQIGSFYQGAMKYNEELSITSVSHSDSIKFVVISPNMPGAMMKYVKECQKLKLPYLFDPAFQIDHFTTQELKHGIGGAQILIGNDYEVTLIEKKLDINHQKLLSMVPIVITTLGSEGSLIESRGASFWGREERGLQNPDSGRVRFSLARMTKREKIHIESAKPLNTSDPTGAGDAYRAGFIAGFLRGFDLKTCGQMGSVASAYTVEKYGTQTHEFTKEKFCKRYQENYGERISL